MTHIKTVQFSNNQQLRTCSNQKTKNLSNSLFDADKNANKSTQEDKKTKGMSLASKILIGTAITTGALVLADYIFCKGAHVKNIGKKLKNFFNGKIFKNIGNNIQEEQFGYKDAMQKLKKIYGTEDANTLITEITSKQGNFIGEGLTKKVYSIDGVEDYVLAVLKKSDAKAVTEPFAESNTILSKFNFGQAVAESKGKAMILGKVNGTVCSLPSWIEHLIGTNGLPKEITTKDAEIVLQKIKEISDFPQSSFEHFAAEFKYLSDNKIRMDVINPNNVLVDALKKRINLIDVLDQKERFSYLQTAYNSERDMIALLLDSIFHTKYIENLPHESRLSFMDYSKTIIKKCKLAAESIGLSGNPAVTREHMLSTVKSSGNNIFIDGYDKFVSLYKDIL